MSELDQKYRDQMNALARDLDGLFNGDAKGHDRKNGFVLLVFPFNGPEGQRTNYISNAERKDMIVALKEIVARFEGQSLQQGRA